MQGTYEGKQGGSDQDAEDEIAFDCQPFEDNQSYDNAKKYAKGSEDHIYTISERNESSEFTCTQFNAYSDRDDRNGSLVSFNSNKFILNRKTTIMEKSDQKNTFITAADIPDLNTLDTGDIMISGGSPKLSQNNNVKT